MTAWLGDNFTPAHFNTDARPPVLSLPEASERMEAARLAMVAAEEAFKAARAEFRQACQKHAEAKRYERTHIAGEVDLFADDDLTGGTADSGRLPAGEHI